MVTSAKIQSLHPGTVFFCRCQGTLSETPLFPENRYFTSVNSAYWDGSVQLFHSATVWSHCIHGTGSVALYVTYVRVIR